MLATPETGHLKELRFQDLVYDPAEDTFILLDALEQDQNLLSNCKLILEIGSGSGCVSAFIAKLLGQSLAAYLCTDLSPLACQATAITATSNSVLLSPITTDLTTSLLPRCHHAIDLLVFNPPYVETISEEVGEAQGNTERLIEKSWAGGANGMEVTDRLLEEIPELLSPQGIFYLVAVKENKPEEIIERMKSKGLTGETVFKRRAGREHLSVLRFRRDATTG